MIPEFVNPVAYLIKRYGIHVLYTLIVIGFLLLAKRAGLRVLALSLVVFVGLVFLLAYFGQTYMLYYPVREVEATPAKHDVPFNRAEIATSDGERLFAWFVPGKENKPVILFCHGNASSVSDPSYLYFLRLVHDMGLSVLIFDYRGFGKSTGWPSEEGTYRDAEAAWEYLRGPLGFEPGNIAIWGKSMGGGPASYLASEHPDCRALVLESTFTSTPDVARRYIPFLPASHIIRHTYPVVERVRDIGSPLLVMHSPWDETVPFGMGREIYAAAGKPKRFLELEGGHVWGLRASWDRAAPVLRDFLLTPPESETSRR